MEANYFTILIPHISDVCVCAQSCSTLHNHMDYSLSDSFVHRIFQARIQEWAAISTPRDLPDPGIKPGSPALQADTLPSEPPGKPLMRVGNFAWSMER